MGGSRTKILVAHRADCDVVGYVLRGSWDSPWCLEGTWHWRDRIGRKSKHGRTPWIELKCNSADCPARCIVLHDDICLLGPKPEPT